eukprot:6198651-Pleurochrysis_carterae.AAC.1
MLAIARAAEPHVEPLERSQLHVLPCTGAYALLWVEVRVHEGVRARALTCACACVRCLRKCECASARRCECASAQNVSARVRAPVSRLSNVCEARLHSRIPLVSR